MKEILILFAHPAFQKSRVNKLLIKDIHKMEGITLHDLYQNYPEMDIDVNHEQKMLERHDIIIFHHPFFWYSIPAMLKEWQDLVLTHGWAYGSEGNALNGKLFLNVISTGGGKEAYCERGYNKFTIRQLISPIEQTANLCRMIFLPPFVVHGTHSITEEEVLRYQHEYHEILMLLRDEQINIKKAVSLNYLNDYLH